MAREKERSEDHPWQQKVLDNLWLLLALGTIIPALMYLAWGMWELAELPLWGGK